MDIQLFAIFSQCLNRSISVHVAVPDVPSGKWLLLLHGYGGNEQEWITKSPIVELAQAMGLVLVAPACSDGYYEDTVEPIGQFLAEELVPFVQTRFPISSKQEDTWIAGASMGGFGSLLIGARYSRIFGKIAAFGGAFIVHDICIGNPAIVGNGDIRYFQRVFGDFFTLEGSDRDPLTHVQNALEDQSMAPVWLLCGEADPLYRSNERMYNTLVHMGASVELVRIPGGHSWDVWSPYTGTMLRWLDCR